MPVPIGFLGERLYCIDAEESDRLNSYRSNRWSMKIYAHSMRAHSCLTESCIMYMNFKSRMWIRARVNARLIYNIQLESGYLLYRVTICMKICFAVGPALWLICTFVHLNLQHSIVITIVMQIGSLFSFNWPPNSMIQLLSSILTKEVH